MGWKVRVTPEMRVQIAPGGDPAAGWCEPADLARTLPPAPEPTEPKTKPCTTPDCTGTYVPVGRRSKCDDCKFPNDREPLNAATGAG